MSKLLSSFGYAFSGILRCIREERNFRIHIVAIFCVVWMSRFYFFSTVEKVLLAVICGIVLTSEMVNSAVERAVDLSTGQIHPLAKAAKDIAAGAVLISAMAAAAAGILLFGHVENLLNCVRYFLEQPLRLLGLAIAAVLAIVFVFQLWDRKNKAV